MCAFGCASFCYLAAVRGDKMVKYTSVTKYYTLFIAIFPFFVVTTDFSCDFGDQQGWNWFFVRFWWSKEAKMALEMCASPKCIFSSGFYQSYWFNRFVLLQRVSSLSRLTHGGDLLASAQYRMRRKVIRRRRKIKQHSKMHTPNPTPK